MINICVWNIKQEAFLMLQHITVYEFSPTGGTHKTALAVAGEMALAVHTVALGDPKLTSLPAPADPVVLVALPVFAGRIPGVIADKLNVWEGSGTKAVTLAVYGNRDYDDALLELNDILTARGFQVIASGACVAQHSMAPAVAEGRPDDEDRAGLHRFAADVLAKLEREDLSPVTVPGNRPYKPAGGMPVTPMTTDQCVHCGACAAICPTRAIVLTDPIQTKADRCILCMSCVAECPAKARLLPPPAAEQIAAMLAPCAAVRRENQYFL